MEIKRFTNSHLDTSYLGDRRSTQRHQLVYYLRVWDTKNNHLLGHIVDFNSQGLMLISEEPLQTGSEYSLEVRLPDPQCGMRSISFKAVCRWSGSNSVKTLFDAGFEMLEKSDGISNLQSMTHAYGFRF